MRPPVPTLALLLGCWRPEPAGLSPETLAARRAAVSEALAFPGEAGPLSPRWSAPQALAGSGRRWSVSVGSYLVRPGFRASALLLTPDRPWSAAVVVAHGHYGEGKSGAEAQDIAHHLAAAGVAALVVDTPGVEEWDVPGRRVHFEGGAHNRALLAAAGTSALALQVEVLRRGVALLRRAGATRIAATGASGGAVQSFWLLLADPAVDGAVLASPPPIPREARPGGCPCDQLPGLPGPDPAVLALLDRPTLWMSEVPQPRPEGLPASAEFRVLEGPHSYNPEMIALALGWLAGTLDLPLEPVALFELPHVSYQTGGPVEEPGWKAIADLPLQPRARWSPSPRPGPPARVDCEGDGPTVLVAGEADPSALRAAGLRTCALTLLDEDEAGQSEALGRGQVWADALAGTLQSAAASHDAVAVWAERAWGLPAAASGLPYVIHDPVLTLGELDPERDPAWIHVPGAWWGGLETVYRGSLAMGDDPGPLIVALRARLEAGQTSRVATPPPASR